MIAVHGSYIGDYNHIFEKGNGVSSVQAYELLKDCLLRTGEDIQSLGRNRVEFERVGMEDKCFRGYRKVGDTLYFLYLASDGTWIIYTCSLEEYVAYLKVADDINATKLPPFPEWGDSTGETFTLWLPSSPSVAP